MGCELPLEPLDFARSSGPMHTGHANSSIALDERPNGSF